jgi:FixJ family two-component response regulator
MMNQSSVTASTKPVVLVVDDYSAMRNSLKFALGVEGFEVRTYSNARELLDGNTLRAANCLVQ